MNAGLEVVLVEDEASFAGLEPEWNALQSASSVRNVFLDHRWVAAWWRHFGAGKTLQIRVMRRGGRLVGLAPLVLSSGLEAFPVRSSSLYVIDDYRHLRGLAWRRVVPLRRLTFVLGMASANLRGHFLSAEGAGAEIVDAALADCRARAGGWDVLVLDGLPEDSEQGAWVRAAAARLGLKIGGNEFRPQMLRSSLPESWDAFLAARNSHFRKVLRQDVRRVEQAGAVSFRVHRGADIDRGMDTLFELEACSWKAAGERRRQVHLQLDDAQRAFHRDVARRFAATDQAQVLVMDVAGRPAAAFYTLERDGATACTLTYMDDALSDKVNTAPLWQAFVQDAVARGLREIDFNGKTRNMLKWAEREVAFPRIVLYSPQAYARVLAAVAEGAQALSRSVAAWRGRASQTAGTKQ